MSAQHARRRAEKKAEKEALLKQAIAEMPSESSEPEVVNELFEAPIPPIPTLYNATDEQLVRELQNRGYTGNIIRKTSFIL